MNRSFRVAALALPALLSAAVLVPPAFADDVARYTFETGADGWTETAATCELLGLGEVPPPFCTVSNEPDTTAKAAQTSFSPVLNAEEALVGVGTQQSPA